MKAIQKLLTAIFLVFIFAFLALLLFLPKTDFSEMENRYLAKMPSLSMDAIMDGSFMSGLEAYITDHFPLRDGWISIKYLAQRGLMKSNNNDIYTVSGGMLLSGFNTPDTDRLNNNLTALKSMSAAHSIPVYITVAPTSSYIYSDRLPYGAPLYDQQALLDALEEIPEYFDISAALLAKRDEYIYYNTDHHWTTLGSYYAYLIIAEKLGLTPVEYPEMQTLPDFYGTLFSKGGARFIAPDTIEYHPYSNIKAGDLFGEPITAFNPDFFDAKDKYSMFFSGNQAVLVLENTELTEGETLVMVRDSFADCMLPFLAQHFKQIHVVDTRYYKRSLADYAENVGADMILALYQSETVATEVSLGLLAR